MTTLTMDAPKVGRKVRRKKGNTFANPFTPLSKSNHLRHEPPVKFKFDKNGKPLIAFLDFFCGAGGFTEAIKKAGYKVIFAINHSEISIDSHSTNNPDVPHATEDIKYFDSRKLLLLVQHYRRLGYAIGIVASPDCTGHSLAGGGMEKKPDSRILPETLVRYVKMFAPDAVLVENVKEFRKWGPLGKDRKPIKKLNSKYYWRWVDRMCRSGNYQYDERNLCAADFGGYTIRDRYFGFFAKNGFPIIYPKPTHSKNPGIDIFGAELKPWKQSRDILDLENEGQSIFDRPPKKKAPVEKTLNRIYAGVNKFTAATPLKDAIVVMEYYGNGRTYGLNQPIGAQTTNDRHAILWLDKQYGSGVHNFQSVDEPAGALTAVNKMNLIKAQFIDTGYSGPYNIRSIDSPSGTLTANTAKQYLVTARKDIHYLMSMNFKNVGHSLDCPAPTLLASDAKKPYYLMHLLGGCSKHLMHKPGDSKAMRRLKILCYFRGIGDIRKRMLTIKEGLKIQGFPEDYYLAGIQKDQRKQIGNSVAIEPVQAWISSIGNEIAAIQERRAAV